MAGRQTEANDYDNEDDCYRNSDYEEKIEPEDVDDNNHNNNYDDDEFIDASVDKMLEEEEITEHKECYLPDNCKIKPCFHIFITKWMATSDIDRFITDNKSKAETLHVDSLIDYLKDKDKIAHEEAYGNSHIKFFIELDDHRNKKGFPGNAFGTKISNFLNNFAKAFTKILSEDNIPIGGKAFLKVKMIKDITAEEIASGARVAVKYHRSGGILGVHIVFTTIITHLSSFALFRHVVSRIKSSKPNDGLFQAIDPAVFKTGTRLRTIHATKSYEDKNTYAPYHKDDDLRDHFYTYISPADIRDCMHVELIKYETKTKVQTVKKVKQINEDEEVDEDFVEMGSLEEQKLIDLVALINFSEYDKRIRINRFVYLYSSHMRGTLEEWYRSLNNSENKIKKEIDYNWDTAWPSKNQDDIHLPTGWGVLCNYAKENNAAGFEEWKKKYPSMPPLEKLTDDEIKEVEHFMTNFDEHEAAKFFHNLCPDAYIYKNDTWYSLQKNNTWDESSIGFVNNIADTLKDVLLRLSYTYFDKIGKIKKELNQKNIKMDQEENLMIE